LRGALSLWAGKQRWGEGALETTRNNLQFASRSKSSKDFAKTSPGLVLASLTLGLCTMAKSVRDYFNLKNEITNTLHNSPDTCEFFLFPRLKRDLKGRRFESIEAVQSAVTSCLINISEKQFQGA